jgi:hypothetical protein
MSSINDLVYALESADKNLVVEVCAEGEYLQIMPHNKNSSKPSVSAQSILAEQYETSEFVNQELSLSVDKNVGASASQLLKADSVLVSVGESFQDEVETIHQNHLECDENEVKIIEDIVKSKCELKSDTNKKIGKEVYKSHLAKFVDKHHFKCSETEFLQKSKNIKAVILRVLTEYYQKQTGSSDDVLFNKSKNYREPQDYKNVTKLCREKNYLFNSLKDLKYSKSSESDNILIVSQDTDSSQQQYGGEESQT